MLGSVGLGHDYGNCDIYRLHVFATTWRLLAVKDLLVSHYITSWGVSTRAMERQAYEADFALLLEERPRLYVAQK